MPYCPICGNEVACDDAFCASCGVKFIHNKRKDYVPVLKTNRSLAKYFFLGILTFGIYDIVVMSYVTDSLNIIASKYDRRHTMNCCLIMIFGLMTLGIVPLVWSHKMCNRIGNEVNYSPIE